MVWATCASRFAPQRTLQEIVKRFKTAQHNRTENGIQPTKRLLILPWSLRLPSLYKTSKTQTFLWSLPLLIINNTLKFRRKHNKMVLISLHVNQNITGSAKELNYHINKKVLLRERKRHTARRVASARYAALCNGGGGVNPSQVGGYPVPCLGRGGTPSQVGGVPHLR